MLQSKQQLQTKRNDTRVFEHATEIDLLMDSEAQNGGFLQAQSMASMSEKLQEELRSLGLKIKSHEDNVRHLKIQKNKLDESIIDLQVILGKHSSTNAISEKDDHSSNQSEEETTEQILRREKSAAGILVQLKVHDGAQASQLSVTKDVLGVVAMLGRVDDESLSRLLSEYLGMETMLALVCKTYNGVKALETYDKEGRINKSSGIHSLGASIGKTLEGRFDIICLENLRPYCGNFAPDDPQRRLDLLKPKLPSGECPPGFIGFAVNMINVEESNLFYVTSSGHGLRETLFYNLFSRLQVYKTREDMICALPFITDGAISLDGGMIKSPGIFCLGNRNDSDVRFPKPSMKLNDRDWYTEMEMQLKQINWKTRKIQDDLKREQSLLDAVKYDFERKKEEFVKFLAKSSAYASERQSKAAEDRFSPR